MILSILQIRIIHETILGRKRIKNMNDDRAEEIQTPNIVIDIFFMILNDYEW